MEQSQKGERHRSRTSGDSELPRLVVALDNDNGEVDSGKRRRPMRERITDWIIAALVAVTLFLCWNAWDVSGKISTLTSNLALLTETHIRL